MLVRRVAAQRSTCAGGWNLDGLCVLHHIRTVKQEPQGISLVEEKSHSLRIAVVNGIVTATAHVLAE